MAAFGHRQRRCDDMLAAVSQDSANYCQASARRDMIMGARMCAQGTSGLLRDAWLGSGGACEFSVQKRIAAISSARPCHGPTQNLCAAF